jgi:phytoene dehydrogenase-like protein
LVDEIACLAGAAGAHLRTGTHATAVEVRAGAVAGVELSSGGVQPRWRDRIVHRRFLPEMVVAHALPLAAQGGLAGRPGALVPDVAGLALAGDWVGPEGMLADAALASGAAAARAIAGAGRLRAA